MPLLAWTVTVKSNVAESPTVSDPSVKDFDDWRRRPLWHGVHDTYFRPVGSTSLMTTLVASAGPSFETWMKMWIVSPWFGFESLTAVATFRSAAEAEIVRSTDAVLFVDTGSVCVSSHGCRVRDRRQNGRRVDDRVE